MALRIFFIFNLSIFGSRLVRAKALPWCVELSSLWLAPLQARGLIIQHTKAEPWREPRILFILNYSLFIKKNIAPPTLWRKRHCLHVQHSLTLAKKPKAYFW